MQRPTELVDRAHRTQNFKFPPIKPQQDSQGANQPRTPPSFISHSNKSSASSGRSTTSSGSRGHYHSTNSTLPNSPWDRDRDLPPLPTDESSSTFGNTTPQRPAHRPTASGGSASQLPHISGMRNFSRPSPALRVIELASSSNGDGGASTNTSKGFSFDDESPELSPPPSSSENRGSPQLREITNEQRVPGRLDQADFTDLNICAEAQTGDSGGMVSRLRHVASASSLGRSRSRRTDRSAPASAPIVPPEESFLPSMARNAALAAAAADHHSSSVSSSNVASTSQTSAAQRAGGGLLRGRKSSFGDLRKGDKAITRDEKRSKPGFWSALRRKDTCKEVPSSAPPTSETFFASDRAADSLDPSLRLTHTAAMSKADRLLGHGEEERRELMAKQQRDRRAQLLRDAKARDVLADYCLDWEAPEIRATKQSSSDYRNDIEPASASQGHRSNAPSTSSRDSYVTSGTGESRVSDRAPTLDSPIGMPSRELSDDIEAVLRSQRASWKGVEDLLSTHRAMASHRPPVTNHYPSNSISSSEASSPRGALSFLPNPRTGHTADSSISSTIYTTSSRSRSRATSVTSSSGPSLRWHDDSTSVLQMPRRRAAAANAEEGTKDREAHESGDFVAALHDGLSGFKGQFEDAEEEQPSPPPFAGSTQVSPKRPPLRTAKTHDASFAQGLPSTRTPQIAMARTCSDQPATASRRDIHRPAVQERAAEALNVLPPLSSLHKACLVASQLNWQGPWNEMQDEPLSASASSAEIPPLFAAYLRAYGRGEFEISNPPKPRLAAVPQSSALGTSDRYGNRGLSDLAPAAQSMGIGLDIDFPLPPDRNDKGTSHSRTGSHSLHSRNVSTMTAAFRAAEIDSSEDLFGPDRLAEDPVVLTELPADLRAPRPPFEAERQRAVNQYSSALGLDGNDIAQFHNIKLSTIAETLRSFLQVTQVRIQLISDDRVITLARSGQLPGEDGEAVRTPRASERTALGISMFGNGTAPRTISMRDESFESHVLLNRNGAPVVLEDLQRDWRFTARDTGGASFYAGASLLSADGLPIGTISTYDTMSRPGGLARDERSHLINATERVMEELEHIRQASLRERLILLDESLSAWSLGDHSASILQRRPSEAAASPSIEATLLSAPPTCRLNGLKPPLSPNTLAQRRGAKMPASLSLAHHSNFVEAQHPHQSLLSAALKSIVTALKTDLAYIAQVTTSSSPAANQGDNARCLILARCDAGSEPAPELHLDGPLHLCALAATKRGLHLQQDDSRVAKLLGTRVQSAKAAAWGGEDDTFHTAAVVNCGLREGSKSWKDATGWVLGVASRSAMTQMAPESTVYLLRFASLLAPMLLDQARSPTSNGSLRSPQSGPKGRARSCSNPSRAGSALSPTSPGRPRSRGAGSASKRVLPPLSPPPNEPLPLLPGASPVQSHRHLHSMDRSVSTDATPRLPTGAPLPPSLRRTASSTASPTKDVATLFGRAREESNNDAVEYVTPALEESESDTSGSASVDLRAGNATTSASFLRMGASARRTHDMLRKTNTPPATGGLPTSRLSAQPSSAVVAYKSTLPSCNTSSDETSNSSGIGSSSQSSPISTKSRLLA